MNQLRGRRRSVVTSNLLERTAGPGRGTRAIRVLPPPTPAVPTPAVPTPPRPSADRVAFVFQGGGSLTAPQVGMLRALTEAGIVADLVVGSSAGALNAVAFASDPSVGGIDRLEVMWRSLRRRHVAPLSARTLFAAVTGRGDGLLSNAALRILLQSGLVANTLTDTHLPAHVMATDLASGSAVVLSDGDTVSALLASSAFPGLYPPVQVGSRWLVDGGVAADIPILAAEALGATVSYVLPAAIDDVKLGRPRGPVPLAYRALGHILDAAGRRDLDAARRVVHLLPTPGTRATNPIDFRHTARLIDEGYRLAMTALLRVPQSAAGR